MIFIYCEHSFFLSQVFKLEGAADRYLFVKPGSSNWGIFSDLKGKKRFIGSGSAGLRCPARPERKFNKRFDTNDWSFNQAGEDDEEDFEEGGIVVRCSVHDQPSDI